MGKAHNIFLYIYAFTIPFEYWDPFGLVGAFSIVRLVAILYFALSILNRSYAFNLVNSKKYLYPILLLFLLMTVINIGSLIVFPIARPLVNFSFLQNIILFWVFCNHFRHNPKIIYSVFLSYAFGIALLGVLYNLNIGIVYRQDRLTVFGDNPNNQGTKVAIGIFFFFYFVIRDKFKLKYFRLILLLPIPLLINFIVSTASRGALLTLFISLFLLILLIEIKPLSIKVSFIIVGSIGVIYLYQNMMSDELLNKRMQQFTEEGSLGGREDIWEDVINIFEKSPLFGVGEPGFSYEMIKIYGKDKSAHNYFLYVLGTSGLIGFFVFLYFLSNVGSLAVSRYRIESEPVYLIIFIVVVFAMLRSGGTLGDKSYWFFLSAIIGSKIRQLPAKPYVVKFAVKS